METKAAIFQTPRKLYKMQCKPAEKLDVVKPFFNVLDDCLA